MRSNKMASSLALHAHAPSPALHGGACTTSRTVAMRPIHCAHPHPVPYRSPISRRFAPQSQQIVVRRNATWQKCQMRNSAQMLGCAGPGSPHDSIHGFELGSASSCSHDNNNRPQRLITAYDTALHEYIVSIKRMPCSQQGFAEVDSSTPRLTWRCTTPCAGQYESRSGCRGRELENPPRQECG